MSQKQQEHAQKVDAEGRCIVCGKAEDGRTRGLCSADYRRLRRAKSKLPPEKQDAFEKSLVEQGLLLPSRQGDRGLTDDAFADALAPGRTWTRCRRIQGVKSLGIGSCQRMCSPFRIYCTWLSRRQPPSSRSGLTILQSVSSSGSRGRCSSTTTLAASRLAT